MSRSNDLILGAIGGIFGGLAMFAVRVVGTQTGIIIHSLPDRFERGVADLTGFAEDQNMEQQKELAIAEHLMLSASLGAGYGLLRRWLKIPALVRGAGFGLVIYALFLLGVGPALGITERPDEKPSSSVLSEIGVHLLFGTVTATVTDWLHR